VPTSASAAIGKPGYCHLLTELLAQELSELQIDVTVAEDQAV
jgi:hypothetical protein